MSKSLRIALPTSSFLPSLGGAEVGLHNIASRLILAGHQPLVIAPAPHVKQLKKLGWCLPYDVVSFPPKIWGILRHFPSIGLKVFGWFFEHMQNKYDFDFWHVTMGYPTGVAFACYASGRDDIRYLIRCAGEDIQRHPGIGYGARQQPQVDRLIHKWLPQAKSLVAITESVASEYRSLGVHESQIVYIPNGVDIPRFSDGRLRKQGRENFGVTDNTFVWLAVGRNHPKKNYIGLLDATKRLVDSGCQDFYVVMAGGKVDVLRQEVVARELEGRVLLQEEMGPIGKGAVPALPSDDLVALYQAADGFVFPSLMETFGIVLVEAMAAGLPVITTDAPGCRDVIREGEDALMVPVDDPEALANAMQQVSDDEVLRNDLIRRSHNRAQDFSWDSVVSRYLKLYSGESQI